MIEDWLVSLFQGTPRLTEASVGLTLAHLISLRCSLHKVRWTTAKNFKGRKLG